MDESKRIALDTIPPVQDAIEALLDDPERLRRAGVHRKTIERVRREGLPSQLRLFVRDPHMARALLAAAEQQAA